MYGCEQTGDNRAKSSQIQINEHEPKAFVLTSFAAWLDPRLEPTTTDEFV